MDKKYQFDPAQYKEKLLHVLEEIQASNISSDRDLAVILKKTTAEGRLFSKNQLVLGYQYLVANADLEADPALLAKIKMKPTRSISGVLPVTVLTRPFPCPGKCIFCPNDVRMPKSYLSAEPGAQRAERNNFDPYLQTYNRLLAFKNTGHDVTKAELIILGGTWSYYPEAYQIWFIKRCFEALNDFGLKDARAEVHTVNIFEDKESQVYSEGKTYNQMVIDIERKTLQKTTVSAVNREKSTWEELFAEQAKNETGLVRCVGLVIETRPDHISEREVIRVRKLGATKTQIGFQSLNDEVLELNKRGHDVAATKKAVALVRSAGFKVHAHWMPNLYGSNPEKDKQDYLNLWTPDFQPDELKIYPCSLIETAELMEYYKNGLWKPYTEAELLDVLQFCLANTPRYVRLTRVVRDIPSTDIVVGNKKTNFRELVERSLVEQNVELKDIRNREIKARSITAEELQLKVSRYIARNSYGETEEQFLEFVTQEDKIAGFLRLSLPKTKVEKHFVDELSSGAIIREVHVYGVAQSLGKSSTSSAQHLGLGKKLIAKSVELAKSAGFDKLAVISAIGTKEYYRKQGFVDAGLYQVRNI